MKCSIRRLFAALAVVGATALLATGFVGCSANRGGWMESSSFTAPPTHQVPGSIGSLTGGGGTVSDSLGTPSSPAIPGARPSPDEELWVIARGQAEQPAPADDLPQSGALMAKTAEDAKPVPMPLKHTDVKASIAGYIASVDVTQQYHNPYDTKIEAVYVFPLPHNAAVSEFVMTVGERRIRGIIRERKEAERIYAEAKSQGYVASLLTQERPNIFTQSVANIEPGKEIDINIRYFHTLAYADGWYEFVFPMVVGPRFNPPGSTDGVGAVGRGAAGISGQATEVQYLKPNERSGHDIALSVKLDAAVPIEKIDSRNHRITTTTLSPSTAEVKLDPADSIPNKDFVLRYKVAGRSVKSGLIAHRDSHSDSKAGGYFALMLVPPEELSDLPRQPLEMVFTLDVSGSMSGKPIEQSRAAMRFALKHMNPSDTFQIVRFADAAQSMAERPLAATAENVQAAMSYMDQTEAGGGTMMLEGIRATLTPPRDPARPRYVAFLTDGYIGNERDILAEIHRSLGSARIFSFGVGSSTNRYLLDHMAKLGQGAVAYLGLNDSADDVMGQYFDRISHPALTDISIDYGSLGATDVYPQRIPDLFVGRPVILTGRFNGDGKATVKVRGRVGGQTREYLIAVNPGDVAADHKALPAVWARMKIADLSDRAAYETNNELPDQIKQIALEYGLMSAYTAFVAVDSTARTAGDHGVSVPVAVPVPDGVRYDTTVQEK